MKPVNRVANRSSSSCESGFQLFAAIAMSAAMLQGCGSPTSTTSESIGSSCTDQHWVTAWEAPPSDAATSMDPGKTSLSSGPDQTFRLILSPLGSGSKIRLHLSNRFGSDVVTLSAVRIAQQAQASTATINSVTSVKVTFDGQQAVSIPAGADIVSDAVTFHFDGLENLAVSIVATSPTDIPTHHFEARQHSFATAPGAGDHSNDADASAFTQSTISRPLLIGLDTLAASNVSSLIAVGDSLTDGHQNTKSTIDLNERYPDYLYQRLAAAGVAVFVANAGISGNRVLQNGQTPSDGPSAISRIGLDALANAGAINVILFEGINDIGQTSGLTAAQLESGYVQLITQFHQQGVNVIQATLTPAGNAASAGYSKASAEDLRQQINTWIRTQSPADAFVDFDAAVRDPNNPAVIASQYDDGDGLHLNAAGYQKLAETVDLSTLKSNACGN